MRTCRGVDDQDILNSILRRLDRLEGHCELDRLRDDCTYARSMSVSSASSGLEGPAITKLNPVHGNGFCDRDARGTIRGLWNQFKDPATRPQALSGIFCHLRPLEMHFLECEKFGNAMDAAIEDLGSFTDYTALGSATDNPMVPRDLARKWVKSTFIHSNLHISVC